MFDEDVLEGRTLISKIIVFLSAAVFIMISIQPIANPVASAAAQGMAFTSPVGPTIFRVSFAGILLGGAAFLAYSLFSSADR